MFGTLIVCYLFLGGAGAGLCLVMAVLGLLSPADQVALAVPRRSGNDYLVLEPPRVYRRLFVTGYLVALVVLVLGVVCLLADVGRADRALLLLTNPTRSFIAVGAWALMLCVGLVIVQILIWGGLIRWGFFASRVVAVLVIVVALVVMVYTGLMLQDMHAVPLWTSPWLPVLFVVSALSCGIALALMTAQFAGLSQTFATVLGRLASADAIVIVLEALAVALLLVTTVLSVSNTGAEGAIVSGTTQALEASVEQLIAGSYAGLFWGGFVGAGLILPFVLDLVLARAQRPMPLLAIASATCVLFGGFIMRLCIVGAGMHPVLTAMLP